jgi:hypothetical protein
MLRPLGTVSSSPGAILRSSRLDSFTSSEASTACAGVERSSRTLPAQSPHRAGPDDVAIASTDLVRPLNTAGIPSLITHLPEGLADVHELLELANVP